MVGALAAFGCLRFAPAVPLRSFAPFNHMHLTWSSSTPLGLTHMVLKDDPNAYAIMGISPELSGIPDNPSVS